MNPVQTMKQEMRQAKPAKGRRQLECNDRRELALSQHLTLRNKGSVWAAPQINASDGAN